MSDISRERLTRLRQELRRDGLDGFIIPRADEHLSEYVPTSAERLAWLTGFTGSAGMAVVLPDRAAAFTEAATCCNSPRRPAQICGSGSILPRNHRLIG